jgi:thymidylate synthase ThyX
MIYDLLKVELCSYWGGDRDIANAAWASTKDVEKAMSRPDEDVTRVVSQLIAQDHGTPKERVFVEFYMEMPIFCERQFDKYRCSLQIQDMQVEFLKGSQDMRVDITQNELSGRYRTFPERAYPIPEDVEAIINATDCGVEPLNAMLKAEYEIYEDYVQKLKKAEADGKINNAEYKRAREVVRGVLGTSYITSMRLVVNLHSFEHIINQRLDPHAQLESRILAYKMLRAVEDAGVAPVAISNMKVENGWNAWCEEIRDILITYGYP